ncbi:efflux RND transporter periplasmic adaptor subunit [Alteromonas ponticola]|uniref:Efflux RND transporter periplasmic adaptor subunit n=1 Tax=Alteromonas ponticola TaxID=2720613 RepID=A0ABX1QYU9_9ALTE|nr:efflux RND transporter periplasmic adaptor subunit [Alteromonas ponticola]NMH59404.1 efflux RND transporter periplasmic adaptor subunit [Alteromonas ponticola]
MTHHPRWNTVVLFICWLVAPAESYAQADNVVPVRVETVAAEAVSDSLVLAGSVNSLQRSELSTEIDGRVNGLNVDVGSKVKQGDLLLALDKQLAQQELSQAQAALEEAQVEYDEAARALAEANKLVDQNHIAKTELLTRENRQLAAKASLNGAKANVSYRQTLIDKHQLFAPFDGIIVRKNAEVGEWHSRGSSVLTLVSTNELRVDVFLPQEKYAQLDTISSITLIPDTQPDQPIEAEIATFVPVGTEGARSFLLRLRTIQNEELVPGTSVMVKLDFAMDQEGIVVSRDALLRHADGGYSAFVVEGDKARRRQLTLGKSAMAGVVVLKGLKANEKVVIRGNEVLQEGQKVKVESSGREGNSADN